MNNNEIRVLIAEDDYFVSGIVKKLLERIGCAVVGSVANGSEAVTMTQSLKPDLVVMDIGMPMMNGIEATQRIQEFCPTPVVMLTAYETRELVEQASAAGAGAYVVKPPSIRELERAIIVAMARFEDMMKLRHLNTELKERNQELHHLNTELQARNEDLDTFSHTTAHDLKNPLGLIIGYAELLAEETLFSEKSQKFLNIIIQTGHKMDNIIEELLQLASVQKTDVVLRPLDMAKIVAEAQRRLIYMIDEYQAKLILPDKWPITLGHTAWVEEVWVNYISNGIKYGGQQPELQLGAVESNNGMIRFFVRDNGPGISPAEQEQLFMPFIRLSQVRPKGYGLGLSIVRRIVEKLDGEVGIESEIGQGSTFSFTLPAVYVDK